MGRYGQMRPAPAPHGFTFFAALLFAAAVVLGIVVGQVWSPSPTASGRVTAEFMPPTPVAGPRVAPEGQALGQPPTEERKRAEEPSRGQEAGPPALPPAPPAALQTPSPTPLPGRSPSLAAALIQARQEAARAGLPDPVAVATELLNATQGDVEAFADQIAARLVPGADVPPRQANAWAHVADLDGDGAPEWIVSVPSTQGGVCADRACYARELHCEWQRLCMGLVLLFGRTQQGFTPRMAVGFQPTPAVLAVEDLLGDGTPELLLTGTHCGAHTCFTGLEVGEWNGHAWRDLTAERMEQSSTTIRVADPGDGGPRQIVFHGGTFGSAGAGLQRQYTLVFAYDPQAGRYHLVSSTPDPDPDSYFRMLDAHAALAAGDLDRALSLATSVLVQPYTDPNADHRERRDDRIAAFAAIEAMLVHALRGEPEQVAALAEEVAAQYDGADNAYVEAAQRLRETYERTGDPVAACGEMARVVRERLNAAQFYGLYGYNQERLRVDNLCAPGSAAPAGQPTTRECARDEQCL
jgi:hypothetical protein